ncbi:MAG: hypothetical protein ACJA01_000672, partial [Saprospiraceae bacterium]
PELEKAYKLSRKLAKIFEQKTTKEIAYKKMHYGIMTQKHQGLNHFIQ